MLTALLDPKTDDRYISGKTFVAVKGMKNSLTKKHFRLDSCRQDFGWSSRERHRIASPQTLDAIRQRSSNLNQLETV